MKLYYVRFNEIVRGYDALPRLGAVSAGALRIIFTSDEMLYYLRGEAQM